MEKLGRISLTGGALELPICLPMQEPRDRDERSSQTLSKEQFRVAYPLRSFKGWALRLSFFSHGGCPGLMSEQVRGSPRQE